VLVDEAQDLSPLNHVQLRRCAGRAGRVIAVGDPKQAIYAFRGADSRSMDSIRALREAWVDLRLRVTFRCPRAIVARQAGHAPGFRAGPGNAEGEVMDWVKALDPKGAGPWTWAQLRRVLESREGGGAEGTLGSCAMLCRMNAPLFAMAVLLVKRGVRCHIMGGGLHLGLQQLSCKLCRLDSMPAADCWKRITAWRADAPKRARDQRERARAESRSVEGGAGGAGAPAATQAAARAAAAEEESNKIQAEEDRADCLLAVLDCGGAGACATAGELRAKLVFLAAQADDAAVVLATAHRAKGLEWSVVVHLEPWLVPPPAPPHADGGDGGDDSEALGRRSWRQRKGSQEQNIRYVIETRARRILILAAVVGLSRGGSS
jgi:superfamily I DNA/RNA helicase